jgi:hypothetical protein
MASHPSRLVVVGALVENDLVLISFAGELG